MKKIIFSFLILVYAFNGVFAISTGDYFTEKLLKPAVEKYFSDNFLDKSLFDEQKIQTLLLFSNITFVDKNKTIINKLQLKDFLEKKIKNNNLTSKEKDLLLYYNKNNFFFNKILPVLQNNTSLTWNNGIFWLPYIQKVLDWIVPYSKDMFFTPQRNLKNVYVLKKGNYKYNQFLDYIIFVKRKYNNFTKQEEGAIKNLNNILLYSGIKSKESINKTNIKDDNFVKLLFYSNKQIFDYLWFKSPKDLKDFYQYMFYWQIIASTSDNYQKNLNSKDYVNIFDDSYTMNLPWKVDLTFLLAWQKVVSTQDWLLYILLKRENNTKILNLFYNIQFILKKKGLLYNVK